MNQLPHAHLVAAAESFAGVSPTADAIYRFYLLDDRRYRGVVANHYYKKVAQHYPDIPARHHIQLVATALAEIVEPITPSLAWAWTGRQRARYASIARTTWSRYQMSDVVEYIIKDITAIAHDIERQVRRQITTEPPAQNYYQLTA